MLDLVIVVLSSFANLLLGLFVLVRNPAGTINRLFAILAVSVAGWSVSNYLADNMSSGNLLFTRLAFVTAVFVALSIFFISNYFPRKEPLNSSRMLTVQAFFAGIIATLSMTPWVVPSVEVTPLGVDLQVGWLFFLYIIFIVQLLVFVVSNFFRRLPRATPAEQAQIKLLLLAIVTYAVLAISTNLILPLVFNSWALSRFGPLFTLLFVSITAYAIIKHKLLDVRFIAARSIAYLLSISLLLLLYVLISSYVLRHILRDVDSDLASNLVNVFVLTLAVLLYQPQKKFFDKITNNIFYRDAYDPQEFLDELNKVLISNVEMGILLRHSARVIEKHLKSSKVSFVVYGEGGDLAHVITQSERMVGRSMIGALRAAHAKIPRVFFTDDLHERHSKLQKQLTVSNVDIVAQLSIQLKEGTVPTAYMLLGQKKSGNQYSGSDRKIIELIADELVVAIQNALRFEEIQNFNITLQQKVDDATHKLVKTNQKLKEMDATKDDFISMASHQLRTPLTSIKGLLSMVVEGDAGKLTPLQAEMLGQAYTSSQRMTYLIADLLNVSRLKSGKFVIERHDTDLAAVAEQEVEQLIETAKARKLTLTCEKVEDFPILQLDETKTRQIIMNFIDNAIYYTPAGGWIKVKVIDKPRSVELHVTDSGVGVAKRDQPKLFTKFYRANNARNMRPDGTGLGLFMAKKVIIAQGGAIVFKSQEGKGSTFGFSFPKTDELTKPADNKEDANTRAKK